MIDTDALLRLKIHSSIIKKILNDGVEKILVRDLKAGLLGVCYPNLRTIILNRSIDRELAAEKISGQTGIDVSPDEVFLWCLFHEWCHVKGIRDEKEADEFASKHLAELRGYERRYKIQIDVDVKELVSKGIKESMTMFSSV